MKKQGRPEKLKPSQVEEIKRRVAGGETLRSLAKEFGVSHSVISAKCSVKAERLRTIARAKLEVDRVFDHLPVSDQGTVINLMDQMKSISAGLMRVADLNGKTATLIAEKGHRKAQKLGNDPSIDDLREIAAYADTGNKLTSLGVSLVQVTKDQMEPLSKDEGLAEAIRKGRLRAIDAEDRIDFYSGVPRDLPTYQQHQIISPIHLPVTKAPENP